MSLASKGDSVTGTWLGSAPSCMVRGLEMSTGLEISSSPPRESARFEASRDRRAPSGLYTLC